MILTSTSRVSQRSSFVITNELQLLLEYGSVSAGHWIGRNHTGSTNGVHYKENETCLNLVSIVAVLFRASIVAAEKQYIMKIMNTNFKGIFQPEMKIS